MPEETIWQSQTGRWDAPASWTNGVPDLTGEPTVARFDGVLSQMPVRSGLAGASAARLITMPRYQGNVGMPGSPLQLALADRCVLRGVGAHHIAFESGYYPIVVCDSRRRTIGSVLTGVIARLAVKDGRWTVGSTCTLAYQLVVNGPNAIVQVRAQASTESMAPVVVIASGQAINERSSGSYKMVLTGGHLLQTGPLCAGDFLFVGPGAGFSYKPANEPASDPQFILIAGFCDFRDSGYTFGVDKLVIGQTAEVEGTTIEGGGYPPTAISAPVDLREEYP